MTTSILLPSHLTLVEVIGRKSHTSLLRVHDSRTDSDIALKHLPAPAWMTRSEADRYLDRACETLAPLVGVQHAGLATVLEYERTEDALLVTREYVPGLPLSNLISAKWMLGQFEARRIASEVGAALDVLASVGMSHASLTSNNVIVRENGGIVVTDAAVNTATETFSLAGLNCSLRSRNSAGGDIHALAAMVYQALTGIEPGTNVLDIDIPAGMRTAIRRALARDRSAFRSAGAFADSLHPIPTAVMFRHVWRPAAAAGILASLATAGNNAISEARRATRHLTSSPLVTHSALRQAHVSPDPISLLSVEDAAALKQGVRRQGTALLAYPEVAALFSLTDSQKAQISSALYEHRSRVGKMVDSLAGGSQVDTASGMAELKQQVCAQILTVLNTSQSARWEELERSSSEPNLTSMSAQVQ